MRGKHKRKLMKIKIEADLSADVKKSLYMISGALIQKDVRELLEAFPPGEHFKMERLEGTITITKL